MNKNQIIYNALSIIGGLTVFASVFYFVGAFIHEADEEYFEELFSTGWNMLSRGFTLMALGFICQSLEKLVGPPGES